MKHLVPRQWTWYYYAAQTQRLSLRLGIVAGRLLKRLQKRDRGRRHDEVLSTTSMDVVLLCGLRRNAY